MTAQIGESLRYNGKNYLMATQPFDIYLKNHRIKTAPTCSANWRGYYGQWKIEKGKLFLVAISANIPTKERKFLLAGWNDCSTANLNYFFPGKKKVLAEWFSGKIRIPTGKMLEYIHMGYASIFEKELILEFKNGIMISEKEIDNRAEFSREGGPKDNITRAVERLKKFSEGDDSGYRV